MLGKEIIMRDLTVINLDADSPNQIFEIMGSRFNSLGYVTDDYTESIKKRESLYPTALPVKPYPIAIPHTEAAAIIRPFIAPIRLNHTIAWGDMSELDNKLDVKLVFMLGFKEPGAHIELLQILMHNFQRAEWVRGLYSAKTEDEFFGEVVNMEWSYD